MLLLFLKIDGSNPIMLEIKKFFENGSLNSRIVAAADLLNRIETVLQKLICVFSFYAHGSFQRQNETI